MKKLTAFRERLKMNRVEFYGLSVALAYVSVMLIYCVIQLIQ